MFQNECKDIEEYGTMANNLIAILTQLKKQLEIDQINIDKSSYEPAQIWLPPEAADKPNPDPASSPGRHCCRLTRSGSPRRTWPRPDFLPDFCSSAVRKRSQWTQIQVNQTPGNLR